MIHSTTDNHLDLKGLKLYVLGLFFIFKDKPIHLYKLNILNFKF